MRALRIGVPRGVRGRLVATYTLAALLLAAVGGVIVATQLRRGLQSTLDASLDLQAAATAALVAQPGTPELADPPLPAIGATAVPRSLTLVFAPSGALVDASPQRLPAVLGPADLAAARRAWLRLTRVVVGQELRLVAVPVTRPDGVWVVVAGASVELVESASDEVDRVLAISAPLLLGAVGLGAWLLSGAALRPVERMRAEAAELGSHDDAGRIGVPDTADQLASLAVTLNELLDRLHRSASRQRDLVADAGHELRTPLSVLQVELELADRPERSREDLADAVGHARIEVERLSRLADDLLFLARADGAAGTLVRPVPTELTALLAASVRAFTAEAERRGVRVLLAGDGVALPLVADASTVRRAVDNLVANAVTATPAGGTVTVSTDSGDDGLRIVVRDTGPGFPVEFLPHALQRFRRADASRTSADGGGSGLGLAITAEIAAAHGGGLTVGNRADGGAVATLTLPRAASGQAGSDVGSGTGQRSR